MISYTHIVNVYNYDIFILHISLNRLKSNQSMLSYDTVRVSSHIPPTVENRTATGVRFPTEFKNFALQYLVISLDVTSK